MGYLYPQLGGGLPFREPLCTSFSRAGCPADPPAARASEAVDGLPESDPTEPGLTGWRYEAGLDLNFIWVPPNCWVQTRFKQLARSDFIDERIT